LEKRIGREPENRKIPRRDPQSISYRDVLRKKSWRSLRGNGRGVFRRIYISKTVVCKNENEETAESAAAESRPPLTKKRGGDSPQIKGKGRLPEPT